MAPPKKSPEDKKPRVQVNHDYYYKHQQRILDRINARNHYKREVNLLRQINV